MSGGVTSRNRKKGSGLKDILEYKWKYRIERVTRNGNEDCAQQCKL